MYLIAAIVLAAVLIGGVYLLTRNNDTTGTGTGGGNGVKNPNEKEK
jgi:hypothetical protein